MPAQPEEIEAAEREGIAIRDRRGGDRGRRARRARSSAVRVQRAAPTGELEGGRATWAPVAGLERRSCRLRPILVAVGEEPDPSILPEGAGIEVSALGRHRGRSADAGHRPGRRLRRRRRRVGAQDDHRRGGGRPPGRGLGPRVPRRRPRRRGARSWPRSAIATPRRAAPDPGPRAARPGPPAAAGLRARLVRGRRRPASTRRRPAPRRAAASAATRSTAAATVDVVGRSRARERPLSAADRRPAVGRDVR